MPRATTAATIGSASRTRQPVREAGTAAPVTGRFRACEAVASSRRRRLVEEPLHNHTVSPLPFELAVAMINADHAEPTALVQGQARDVLRVGPREDLPIAT